MVQTVNGIQIVSERENFAAGVSVAGVWRNDTAHKHRGLDACRQKTRPRCRIAAEGQLVIGSFRLEFGFAGADFVDVARTNSDQIAETPRGVGKRRRQTHEMRSRTSSLKPPAQEIG